MKAKNQVKVETVRCPVCGQIINQQSAAAKSRWEKTTEKERKEHSKMMNERKRQKLHART